MQRLMLALAASAVLALAACDDPPQGAQSGPEVAVANDTTPEAMGGVLPVALQGRWGLVAADCTTTMGDDKGLLTIAGDSLTFYESRAQVQTVNARSDSRIDAEFSFSGEGMTWQRRLTLDVQDEGAVLIRRDYGEDAEPGPLRYERCPA